MPGKFPIKPQTNDNALGRCLNKVRAEAKRSGAIQGHGGITVAENGAGIFIGYADPCYDRFAKLNAALTASGAVTAALYSVTSVGAWAVGADTLTVYGSPMQGTSTLPANTVVHLRYFPAYGRWVVVNASC